MSFDEIFKICLLIGGVIMFIMSFILWFHPSKAISNKILAVLIFAWAICVLLFDFQSAGFYHKYPYLFGVGTNLTALFFPLMFLYIKFYINDFRKNYRTILLHLSSFIIFSIILSPIYFTPLETKLNWITISGLPTWVKLTIDICAWGVILMGIIYTVLSFQEIKRFETDFSKSLDADQLKAINWIKQFLLINIFLWAVGTSGVLLSLLDGNLKIDLFKLYYFGLTLLTLRMSIFSAYNPYFYKLDMQGVDKNEEMIIPAPTIQKNTKSKFRNSYLNINRKNDNVSIDENEKDLKIITTHIEETKPYLNSNISLQDLADETGLSKHRVSELLNNNLGMSFYDVINDYRVKEVIRLINEGKHEQHKLLHLAELAGFNSKATFNRIFKKTTGRTPSQYIQELAA